MSTKLLAGKRVLVVEDEMLIGYDIATSLNEAGAIVVGPCATLDEARKAARTEIIDVAVLDIDIAGEEVFPAADVLIRRRIPFMFYTGQPQRERLAGDLASIPVWTKPVNIDRLIVALSQLTMVAA